MRTVIAFDIASDRRRYRVVRALLDVSIRTQKSVFEAPDLPPRSYLRLRSRLEGFVDPEEDALRYYRLCSSCSARIEWYGVGPGFLDPPEEFEILGLE